VTQQCQHDLVYRNAGKTALVVSISSL